MNRARVSIALLSVLLWHVAAPCFVTFLPTPAAQGQVFTAAHEEGDSGWLPNATRTADLVNAIRDDHVRPSAAHPPAALCEELPPRLDARRIVRPHRSPYPTRRTLRMRLIPSESGELPH